jgi:Tfp pilus assembly pilus retraction ATPase PilT
LHTGSVSETIDRLIGLMSEDNNQDYVRTFISRQLISIINQKLIYVDFKDKIITK